MKAQERIRAAKELLDDGWDSGLMSYDTQAVNQAHRILAGGDAPRETKSDRKPETADKQKVYLTKRKRKLQGDQLDWFNDFWKTFDYKAGKAEAADTWLDLKITEDELPEILQGAEREAQSRPSALQAGRTPKMAQGWLSGRRWEDEPLEIPVRPSKPLDPSAYIVPDDWKRRGFAVDIKQREGETYTQFRQRILEAGG